MKRIFALAVFLPFLANATPITLDFDEGNRRWIDLGTTIDSVLLEDGFVVDGIGANNHIGIGPTSWCGPRCPDNGTQALRVSDDQSVVSITRADGGLFSVLGFDGAEFFNGLIDRWATTITFTGTYNGGGTVSQNFLLDFINDGEGGGVDFQGFNVSQAFTGLTSLTIVGSGGSLRSYYSIDNIRLDTAAVPTPGTLGLLGLGLAAIGLRRRRGR